MPRSVPQPAQADAPNPTTPRTLAEAFEAARADFAELVAAGVRSAVTWRMHAANWGRWISHLNEQTPLESLDADVILSAARYERAGRRVKDGARQPITNSTLRKRLATLSLCLRAAKRRRWIDRLPEFPSTPYRYRPTARYLRNVEELELLCATLPLERVDWVVVAVYTAQHPSDVERMRAYTDCDPFASPPWMLVRNTKNHRAALKVEMPEPLAVYLRRLFEAHGLKSGDRIVRPWAEGGRTQTLHRRSKALGLMKLNATALRHTFATWVCEELGYIPKALQEWLGHSSMLMLEKVYTHATAARCSEIARVVARRAFVGAQRFGPSKSSPDGKVPADKENPVGARNTDGASDRRRARKAEPPG